MSAYLTLRATLARGWPVVTEESVTHPVPADESPLTFSESDQGASGSVGAGCFAEMQCWDGCDEDDDDVSIGSSDVQDYDDDPGDWIAGPGEMGTDEHGNERPFEEND